MSKITLSNVKNYASWTSAGNTVDNNSSTLQSAFDNTLSRDGTSPNEMGADFDMNSNQILNLPFPGTPESPLRLMDFTAGGGGGGGGSGGGVSFDTRSAAIAAHIPTSTNVITTGGYATVGDGGGATYAKVNSLTYPTYGFTDASGHNWQYVPESAGWNAKVAGVIADGVTDDSTNMMNALLPFQNSSYVLNGGGLVGRLILPNAVINLTNPIIIVGPSVGGALEIVGQNHTYLGTTLGTIITWDAAGVVPSSTVKSAVQVYGLNQALFQDISFVGNAKPNKNLSAPMHLMCDDSFVDVLGGSGIPVSGSNKVATITNTMFLEPGTTLGIGAATANFEIVYIREVLSSTQFTADFRHTHAAGEHVGTSPATNDIIFQDCTFASPGYASDSTGMIIGTPFSGTTTQVAQLYLNHSICTGGVIDSTVTFTNASPTVVSHTAHGWSLGRPVQYFNTGGALPTGVTDQYTYYIVPKDANSYWITLDLTTAATITGATNTILPAATPGLVQWTGHGLSAGQPVSFTTTGSLPDALTAGTTYYVLSGGGANSFQISTTPGGSAINFSYTAGSGYGNTTIQGGNPTLVNTSSTGTGTQTEDIRGDSGVHIIAGGNTKNFYFNNSQFRFANYGIKGDIISGSCEVLYPTYFGNFVTDNLMNNAGSLVIENAESETHGCAFLIGTGGSGSQGATLIQNSHQTSSTPSDGYVIKWGGSLQLLGNTFIQVATTGPSGNVVPKVKCSDISNFNAVSPTSIFSCGNYFQHGGLNSTTNVPISVFFDGSNNPYGYSDNPGVTRKWVVQQFGDYGDLGKYPTSFGYTQNVTTALGLDSQSAGITNISQGINTDGCMTVTVPYTAFQAAATSTVLTLFDVPAKTKITGAIADVTVPFAGTAGTLQLRVGSSGSADNSFLLAFDAKSAAITKGLANGDFGTALDSSYTGNHALDGYCQSWSGGDHINTTLVSGSGNLSGLNAGSVTIYVTTKRFN